MTARHEVVTAPPTAFPAIVRRSITMDAAALIKDMILDGRLHPGDRLPSERTLSEALGVSRPSVREAIRSLVAMHILESRHGAGTFVSSLSLDQLLRPLQFVVGLADSSVRDVFDVQVLIEPGAAALAAERADDEEIEVITRTAMESTRAKHGYDERARLDVEWHDLIVRSSHNGLLINLHQSISILSAESRAITVRIDGIRQQAVEDHARIAGAIAARDPAAAEQAMREHLEHVRIELRHAVDGAQTGRAKTKRPRRNGATG